MTVERGDVVYGAGPFKGEEYARPWLVVSNEAHPFQGDQYIVLALTSKTWHDDSVPIPDDAWIDGGAPKRSSVLPRERRDDRTVRRRVPSGTDRGLAR